MSQFPNCSRAGLEVKSLPAVDKRYKEIIAAKDVERYLASRMSVDHIIKCREAIKVIKDHYETERTVHLPETGSYVPKDNMSQKAENNDTSNKHVAGGNFISEQDVMNAFEMDMEPEQMANYFSKLLQERGIVVWKAKHDILTWNANPMEFSETCKAGDASHTALLISIQPIKAKEDTEISLLRELSNVFVFDAGNLNLLKNIAERTRKLLSKTQEPK